MFVVLAYIKITILMSSNHHYLMLTPDSLSNAGQILDREYVNKGQIKGMVTALSLEKISRVETFLWWSTASEGYG